MGFHRDSGLWELAEALYARYPYLITCADCAARDDDQRYIKNQGPKEKGEPRRSWRCSRYNSNRELPCQTLRNFDFIARARELLGEEFSEFIQTYWRRAEPLGEGHAGIRPFLPPALRQLLTAGAPTTPPSSVTTAPPSSAGTAYPCGTRTARPSSALTTPPSSASTTPPSNATTGTSGGTLEREAAQDQRGSRDRGDKQEGGSAQEKGGTQREGGVQRGGGAQGTRETQGGRGAHERQGAPGGGGGLNEQDIAAKRDAYKRKDAPERYDAKGRKNTPWGGGELKRQEDALLRPGALQGGSVRRRHDTQPGHDVLPKRDELPKRNGQPSNGRLLDHFPLTKAPLPREHKSFVERNPRDDALLRGFVMKARRRLEKDDARLQDRTNQQEPTIRRQHERPKHDAPGKENVLPKDTALYRQSVRRREDVLRQEGGLHQGDLPRGPGWLSTSTQPAPTRVPRPIIGDGQPAAGKRRRQRRRDRADRLAGQDAEAATTLPLGPSAGVVEGARALSKRRLPW